MPFDFTIPETVDFDIAFEDTKEMTRSMFLMQRQVST